MNNNLSVTEQMLDKTKQMLKMKQEEIKRMVSEEIDYVSFERNMISSMLYMIELKERIRTLEMNLTSKGRE